VGFMDKAKKLAEQAQEKLDEAQKQFKSGGQTSGQQADGGVRYDEHGRPEGPPAGEAAPPSGQPPADAPTAPAAPAAPAAKEPSDAPASDKNVNPDPFKPIQ
jgi:hypothetical protein